MPRTIASGDDVVVGTKVPSTAADSSKGTRTTQPQKTTPSSNSNVSDTGNTGGGALVSRPPSKFGVRKLAVKRAPT